MKGSVAVQHSRSSYLVDINDQSVVHERRPVGLKSEGHVEARGAHRCRLILESQREGVLKGEGGQHWALRTAWFRF